MIPKKMFKRALPWWLFGLLAAIPGMVVLGSLIAVALLILKGEEFSQYNEPHTWQYAWQYIWQYIWHVTLFTLKQATLSSLASLLVGVFCALSLLCRVGKHDLFRFLPEALLLCFVLPPIVVVFGVLDLFGYNGLVNRLALALFSHRLFDGIYGLGGIVVAHVFYNAPLVAYVCLQRLQAAGEAPLQLAADLRFSFGKVLRHVLMPCLKPALGSLAVLVFILCLTSFTVVISLGGGPRATTLPVAVFESIRVDFDPARAAFLSLLQVLLSFAAFFLLAPDAWQRLLPETRGTRQDKSSLAHIATLLLPRSLRLIGDLATLLILSLPLLVVATGIVQGASQNFALLTEKIFLDALLVSLVLGGSSALICCVVVLPLLWSLREGVLADKDSALPKVLLAFAAYPLLAVPPVVVAASLFLLFHASALYKAFPLAFVFLCLVLINGMLALPIVLRFFADSFFAVARDGEHLWNSLKLSPWRRWQKVDLPAVRKSLKAGLACAFCISIGDLSAVALFGRDEIMTLPYLAYLLMGRYRWQEASLCLAVLVLLYFLVFCLFAKTIQAVAAKRESHA